MATILRQSLVDMGMFCQGLVLLAELRTTPLVIARHLLLPLL